MPCFYCPTIPSAGQSACLMVEESHHAVVVRRLQVDDAICLIDGNGTWAHARIEFISRRNKRVEFRIDERQTQALPRRQLQLATARPKGDRQSVLVEMVVQLGVTRLTPLRCQHALPVRDSHTRHWKKIALEACKQSGRAWLPALEVARTLEAVLADSRERGALVCLAHPQAAQTLAECRQLAKGRDVCLLVGPQGGFTDTEVMMAQQMGAMCVHLGQTILRIETAAVALLSTFSFDA